ncbi:hypothetical protein [Sphingobium fuliginis]|uniref:Uncharacterized protein n=1 Tax=Sphingobium fuliginis ATCC 27551 TaxID=1208342 RepID=A0A5B8CAH9_SPHSA|nr:hypothetical protein [Sphingobium fuliginis]QDC36474.1 hypothetical protein FIL70_03655 [Sphingobium fuliginis ATCC 27551]
MTLTPKQRVKINAALAIINDEGHNARAVQHAANVYIQRGYDPVRSYDIAVRDFGRTQPQVAAKIAWAHKLADASSPATIEIYDRALNTYRETGDQSVIDGLGSMIAQDSIALAVHEGRLDTSAVVSSEALEIAMGFAPGESMTANPTSAPPAAAAPEPVPTAPAQPSLVNDRQTSAASVRAPPVARSACDREKAWAGVPTGAAGVRTASGGYRAPMTGERAARWAGEATGLSLSAIRAGEGSEAVA